MAQRRMFSQRVTNSGRFLQMSASAQALYFHLCMNADDDGVVEASMVLRLVNANEDDFRALISKEYVKPLNVDLVTHVTDWLEHNQIRPDRKIDSIYKQLLVSVVPNAHVIEPKPRADTGVPARGRPLDVHWTAQVRLGEVRLGKGSNPDTFAGFDAFWSEYPKKVGKPAALRAWLKERPEEAAALAGVAAWKESESWRRESGRYVPNPATFLNQRRWEDEVPESAPVEFLDFSKTK